MARLAARWLQPLMVGLKVLPTQLLCNDFHTSCLYNALYVTCSIFQVYLKSIRHVCNYSFAMGYVFERSSVHTC